MKRKEFLKRTLGGVVAMSTITDLKALSRNLPAAETIMPAVFAGHGSPMNGIEDNQFSAAWAKLGQSLPVPKAVLVISAHWYTRGTHVSVVAQPETIHDFGGFPQALYDVQYPAPGHPELARETAEIVKKTTVGLDHEWGLDHGAWTVVRRMYPDARVPVFQLSIDYTQGPQFHYELAYELRGLRKKGVLILGSGNLVHNLRTLDWSNPEGGYDWAIEANEKFKTSIINDNLDVLIRYPQLGQAARLSVPTPDHFLPALYVLGVRNGGEPVSIFNDKTVMGSISMTSFQIG